MAIKMSKEEIALTIAQLEDFNNHNLKGGYDRVIERMCNYIDANMDDFMECYDECDCKDKD